jgi:uroporphyrin-III C-methyltransferase / precorrin-2 dehydrogenase / sirohydrochlorin ferrochelatase
MKPSDLPKPQNRFARIEPLSVLPVFLELHGKMAVVVGDSEAALWKAELLLQSGAHVRWLCQSPTAAILQLVTDAQGNIELTVGDWRLASFDGAALVIADIAETEAQDLAQKASAAKAWVNTIDKPAFCQFQFGAIVNKSPLVIGISTTGAAPVLAQNIRTLLETFLPTNIQSRAKRAATIRLKVSERLPSPASRRLYWKAFFSKAFGYEAKPRIASAATHVIYAATADDLTLRDVRALQSADYIYIADQCDRAILNFARREANRSTLSAEKMHHQTGRVVMVYDLPQKSR